MWNIHCVSKNKALDVSSFHHFLANVNWSPKFFTSWLQGNLSCKYVKDFHLYVAACAIGLSCEIINENCCCRFLTCIVVINKFLVKFNEIQHYNNKMTSAEKYHEYQEKKTKKCKWHNDRPSETANFQILTPHNLKHQCQKWKYFLNRARLPKLWWNK